MQMHGSRRNHIPTRPASQPPSDLRHPHPARGRFCKTKPSDILSHTARRRKWNPSPYSHLARQTAPTRPNSSRRCKRNPTRGPRRPHPMHRHPNATRCNLYTNCNFALAQLNTPTKRASRFGGWRSQSASPTAPPPPRCRHHPQTTDARSPATAASTNCARDPPCPPNAHPPAAPAHQA
jgi:hypothetical protein